MFNVNKNTRTTSDIALMFLLLTLNIFDTFFSVSIADFKQVNVSREYLFNNVNPHFPF